MLLLGSAYLLPFAVPLIVALGIAAGGAWTWLGWFAVFVVHPINDTLIGQRAPESSPPFGHRAHSALLWLYVPVQLALLFWALGRVTDAGETFGALAFLGAAASLGTVNGAIGITVAHELVHRRSRLERALGVVLLSSVGYAHFRIEHVYGHHKNVGTPGDPTTARRGESLPRFWWRAVTMSWLGAWRIESRRGAGAGNRMVHYLLIQGAVSVAVFLGFGAGGVKFLAAQALVAVLLLETVNYIEHYGLERGRGSSGLHEPVTDFHSWDSRHPLTNRFLFNLGRHAHHHREPQVPYEDLRPATEGRALPFGYSVLFWVALWPPAWNRLIENARKG